MLVCSVCFRADVCSFCLALVFWLVLGGFFRFLLVALGLQATLNWWFGFGFEALRLG